MNINRTKTPLRKVKTFSKKYKRYILPGALLFGFLFDALTLTRVDKTYDHFVMITNIFIVGISIAVLFAINIKTEKLKWFKKRIVNSCSHALFNRRSC